MVDSVVVGRSVRDVCHLSTCAVRGEMPDNTRVATMDLDEVYRVAQRHLLTSACATALESAGVADERFRQARGKAVRKVAAMDIERTRIFSLMDAADIWHVPLKGVVLQGVYPAYGMRQLSDNDVLFDASRAKEVRDIMLSLGFSCEHFGTGAHDVYFKEPVCNFEMHRCLFDAASGGRVAAYYGNVERLLVADGDGTCGRHLADEDLYVYLIAHTHKHFASGGTGLRSLLDTYVFMRARGLSVDWAYVDDQLEEVGLLDFEASFRSLAMRLFDGRELTGPDEDMLAYVASSGAYGTVAHSVENQMRRYGRMGYLVRRAFLPYESMARMYPVLERVPVLLPVCWAHRWASALTTKPEKVAYQLRAALR